MSQEDPLVCYIVVRGSLGMSMGKSCAQVAHAIQHLFEHYFKIMVIETKLKAETLEHAHLELTGFWIKDGSRKVILDATDEQWNKLKEEYGKGCLIVKDAGLTEVPPNTETVMCLWPNYRTQASNTIKQMKALK